VEFSDRLEMEIENINSTIGFEHMSAEEVYAEGELFLNAGQGLKFIGLCEQKNWAILGIEGGISDGTSFTPDLNLIRDYSVDKASGWKEFREDCNSKAHAFLEAFSGEEILRFYLTFVNEQDFCQLRGSS